MGVLTGEKIIIAEWCNLGITFLLVVFRQYLRFHFGNRFNLCDLFVVLAWLSFLLQGSLDTAIWRLGIFDGKISHTATEFGPEHGLATYDDTVSALRLVYVETITYYNCMYFVKWSMLAFYESLIPRQMKKLRIALWVTTALTVIGFVSTFFVKLFICMPMWENYTPGTRNCDPANSKHATLVRWTQHIFTDLLVYLLPLFLLKTLQLKRSQKIGIGATFFVGFICIFFACAENVSIWLLADYPTIWFFADLEQTWAMIVVCCPALRALFKLIEKNRSEAMSGMSGSYGAARGSRSKKENVRSRPLSGRENFSRVSGRGGVVSLKRVTSDEEMADDEYSKGGIPLQSPGMKMQDSIMVTYEIESANSSAASNHGGDDDEKKLVQAEGGRLTTIAYAN